MLKPLIFNENSKSPSTFLKKTPYICGLISWAFVLFFPQSILAERKTVALGMLGGITGSSFWGDDVEEFDTQIWPTVGMTLALHLPVFLGIEVDLLYVSKGGTASAETIISESGDKFKQVNKIKAHALEIPFLLKVTAPTEGEVNPIFFGGPSMAYLVTKKTSSEIVGVQQNGFVEVQKATLFLPEADVVDFDWSLCLGGGVEWGMGSFQLRFNFGKNSLDKKKNKDIKTAVVALMAGFTF